MIDSCEHTDCGICSECALEQATLRDRAELPLVVYMNKKLAPEDELAAATEVLGDRLVFQRTHSPRGSLVVPRYSALPSNDELCADLAYLGATPINTFREHNYVANLRNWYYDLAELTPRTWFALDQIPDEGPFVLKGQTNSKKHQWATHMFARNKREAGDVYWRLCIDGHVGAQQVFVREYVPLHKLADAINGLPISEEYRFFVLDGQVLASGFYWANFADEVGNLDPKVVPEEFVADVIRRVGTKCRFWVVDIARKADGGWIVVELNDGQQSGLSMIDPLVFYRALHERLAP